LKEIFVILIEYVSIKGISMKKTLLCLLSVVFVCASAYSITWNEVAAMGEKNSHDLVAAQKQLESKEWSFRKSYTTFLPQLSASAGYSESNQVGSDTTTKSYSYGFSATQNLFQGMDEYYGVQSAYANLEYQRADLQAAKASVFYNIRSAFIDMMTAQENVKLLKKILDSRKQNAKLIQLRYESGREDKGNLMATKANEASANFDLKSANRDMDLAWLKLSQLIQRDISGEVEDVEAGPAEAVDLHRLVKETPDHVKAAKTLEMAELSQRSTISEFLPTLSMRASDSKSGAEWPPETTTRGWSLNMSYSFLPGGSNLADWAISAADLDTAKENYSQNENDLLYSLKQTYQNYLNALDSLDVSKVSLAANAEREKITTAKYLNGLATYDEWSRIEDAYIQAQKGLLSAKRSALIAEAAWHKSYGGWVK
jgi:outer membrane protein TolC